MCRIKHNVRRLRDGKMTGYEWHIKDTYPACAYVDELAESSRSHFVIIRPPAGVLDHGKAADRMFEWMLDNLPYSVFAELSRTICRHRSLRTPDGSATLYLQRVVTPAYRLMDDDYIKAAVRRLLESLTYLQPETFAKLQAMFSDYKYRAAELTAKRRLDNSEMKPLTSKHRDKSDFANMMLGGWHA